VDEPLSVIGNIKNLKHLDLSYCTFTMLPESFSNLDHLEFLLLDKRGFLFPPTTSIETASQ